MENKTLIDWLERMIDIQELRENVYPNLNVLSPQVWDGSPYKLFAGDSELKGHYHSLVGEGAAVSKVIMEASDADLAEVLHPTQKEIDTRQGLVLLETSRDQLNKLHTQIMQQLREYQCVRDGAMEEMERRARVNIVANGGEHLNNFVSRFIFGPDVTPIMPYPDVPPSATNKITERDWIRARVKSGKTVYVNHLNFDIPDVYKQEVVAALKTSGLIKENTTAYYHSYYADTPPSQANQKIARFYYKFGFKPRSEVTVYYYCYYNHSSWNNGWGLGRSRGMKTTDLEPIE